VRPLTDAYVLEAELALREGVDPAAVGAAVTVELCGHWEHEGLRPRRAPPERTAASVLVRQPARAASLAARARRRTAYLIES
jgi:hypothetical protein